MKKFTQQVIKEKSGFRFRRTFVYMRRKYGTHWSMKVIFLSLGILLLLAGIVMMVTPGPGWIALLLGIIIIASVYYPFAQHLDKAEKKVVSCYFHFRKRWK